ncbi:MAG TPA: hypothetical protein ENN74_03340, partial [Firmicutes bacterium]|nr:hypothetical protein [Bacillota bacterium]
MGLRWLQVLGKRLFFMVGIILLAQGGQAELGYRATLTLPFSGGIPQLHGDLVPNDTGAAAVYSRPEAGGRLGLMFYRFAADLSVLVERPVAPEVVNHYEPSLCWDGQNYGVVSSTFNQATFMILSPAGDIVLAPLQLPGPPAGEGWRTAAFRVLWTGNAYAVFGILAEPEYPWQTQGSYYTHLTYWLLNGAGEVLAQKDLGSVTPLAYPSFEGAEKEYYDVVWTGAAFFLAHQWESTGFPPVFQIGYRMVDLQGNPLQAEAPATTLPTKGAHLDTNGAAIGLACLRDEGIFGGNSLYARFFSLDGTPLGDEVRYDDTSAVPTGYAPQIFTYRGRFIATYVYPDPLSVQLEYVLKFAEFDGAG